MVPSKSVKKMNLGFVAMAGRADCDAMVESGGVESVLLSGC